MQREGNDDEAEALLERSWEMFDFPGAPGWLRGRAVARLGSFVRRRGDNARAAKLLREAIGYFQEFHARPDIAGCLEDLARVARDGGQPVRAATLFGAASALRESTGAALADDTLQALAGDVDTVRRRLGAGAFATAWSRGRARAVDEAVEIALSEGELAPEDRGDSPLAALTAREVEVARLVADGLTNAQIAERLVVSEGTARTHVERIRRKLGCRSRVQVATLVTQEQRQLRQP
jgi:DNA-binding CsgD family transcriptional regulator